MEVYLVGAGVILIYFFLLFLIAQKIDDNSIVDIGWGAGFVLTTLITLLVFGAFSVSTVIIALLVSIWGVRLAYHIGKRNIGKPEDPRYVEMRKKWGKDHYYLKAYFNVFFAQGFFMFVVVSPALAAIASPQNQLGIVAFLGIAVWIVGFLFEAVGDYQLKQFLSVKENRGTLMTTGLRKYTRHPNYFGESMMRWGIFIVSFGTTGNFLTVISPVTITYLLVFVSGVPLLEKSHRRKEGYEEYARKTNTFIPWFPKK
ncbi:MAG TPA: steroid 5-alpha reductase [Eubacteriaceae bacterium]|nr:steroid 5-alpha reductase [Eubacteriaceae bacterium]